LVIGIAGCYFVAKGQFDKRFNAVSNELATSKSLNNDLRTANTELQAANSQSTATVERLKQQLSSDNRRFNATIEGLKSAIGETAAGLGSTTDVIQSVIEGLDGIKSLIRSLP
jgi:hypothetical protein